MWSLVPSEYNGDIHLCLRASSGEEQKEDAILASLKRPHAKLDEFLSMDEEDAPSRDDLKRLLKLHQSTWNNIADSKDAVDTAIDLALRQVSASSDPCAPEKARIWWHDAATGFAKRFSQSGSYGDFAQAIQYFKMAISGNSLGSTSKTPLGSLFAHSLADFLSGGPPTALLQEKFRADFYEKCGGALSALCVRYIDPEGILGEAASSFREYFRPFDLEEHRKMVEQFREAVRILDEFYPDDVSRWGYNAWAPYKLGVVYTELYRYDLSDKDDARAANLFTISLRLYPNEADGLLGFAKHMFLRVHTSGKLDEGMLSDLESSITTALRENANKEPSDTYTCQKNREALLFVALTKQERFGLVLEEKYINQSLNNLDFLMDLPGDHGRASVRYKVERGNSLRMRFRHCEDKRDIDEALNLAEEALLATYSDTTGHEKGLCLESRAKTNFISYEFFETASLLDPLIRDFLEIFKIELARRATSDILAMCLNNIGFTLALRFQKLGAPGDMETAIGCLKSALSCFEDRRRKGLSLQRNSCLQALGDAYLKKHWRTSGVEFLDEAIKYYEKCVERSNPDHVQHLYGASQLSYCLVQRTFRTGSIEPLADALKKTEYHANNGIQVLSPIDNINRHLAKGFAMTYLSGWGKRTNEQRLGLLDMAIEIMEKLRTETPTIAARSIYVQDGLVWAYRERAKYMRSPDCYGDLVASLDARDMIIKGDQWANHKRVYIDFAWAIYESELAKPQGKAPKALEYLSPLTTDATLSAWIRLQACTLSAQLYFDILEDPQSAVDYLLRAHGLVADVMSPGLKRSDQLQLLKEMFNPSYSVLVFLTKGDAPLEALRLLEDGRNIFWNNFLNGKSVFTGMGPTTTVYRRLRRLSVTSLDRAADSATGKPSLLAQPPPVQPRSPSPMSVPAAVSPEDAIDGPIVVINVHGQSSSALILTHGDEPVLNVDLHSFREWDCWSQRQTYLEALTGMESDDDAVKSRALDSMHGVLRWLWESAAEPILDRLGIHGHLRNQPCIRRIWWVTTEFIGALPIHAAGDHWRAIATKEPTSVIDRVVSSYIPTIGILRAVRQRVNYLRSLEPPEDATALIVSMPQTPDKEPLGAAGYEAGLVEESLKAMFRVQAEVEPTSGTVATLLQKCSVAHFICHTLMHKEDPSKAKLMLRDWRKKSSLDVNGLLELEMWRCQLTYLSACESARDPSVTQQALHIAAGFLMAGVPNVVATLWKVRDEVAPQVAKEFYAGLKLGHPGGGLSNSAMAVHNSITKLRDGSTSVFDWAPYIHYGC